MIEITEQECQEMMFGLGNPGVCIGCGMVDEYAGCEPDARFYSCPECEEDKLFGLEEAIIMGHLTII